MSRALNNLVIIANVRSKIITFPSKIMCDIAILYRYTCVRAEQILYFYKKKMFRSRVGII